MFPRKQGDKGKSQTHFSPSCPSLSHLAVCGCNAENNQNETAGGHENTLLFGFIARCCLASRDPARALLLLPPIWNSFNNFLKRLTLNEHWSRVASNTFRRHKENYAAKYRMRENLV